MNREDGIKTTKHGAIAVTKAHRHTRSNID